MKHRQGHKGIKRKRGGKGSKIQETPEQASNRQRAAKIQDSLPGSTNCAGGTLSALASNLWPEPLYGSVVQLEVKAVDSENYLVSLRYIGRISR